MNQEANQTLTLTAPATEDEQQIMEMVADFLIHNESTVGSHKIEKEPSFATWLKKINTNLPDGVKRLVFILKDKQIDRALGFIMVRDRLTANLQKIGGHVSYSIRPSERKKGYAKKMLNLGLEELTKLGVEKALITCDKNNVGSARTILGNGGKLADEFKNEDSDKITQRYWIELAN